MHFLQNIIFSHHKYVSRPLDENESEQKRVIPLSFKEVIHYTPSIMHNNGWSFTVIILPGVC